MSQQFDHYEVRIIIRKARQASDSFRSLARKCIHSQISGSGTARRDDYEIQAF